MRAADTRGVLVDDTVLPAAAHLTGPGARHVLAAALDAAGGRLERARACHLQYRPGHDVVVRFDGRVRWGDRDPVMETLVAATTVGGPPAGTLPVEAETTDGTMLAVGVWRWPFDPAVVGLADAVTPSSCSAFLGVTGPVQLEVLAYRPTLRAVVRVTTSDGDTVYVKAVPPAEVAGLVDRHGAFLAAGVPVPRILGHDAARGLIAMAELAGSTVRDRLKAGRGPLPHAAQYEALFAALNATSLDAAPVVAGRAATGIRHAAMLATVLPAERSRLDELGAILRDAADDARARAGVTIHGDLYEAQLVTGSRRRAGVITGVLDLDDAGIGDPLDDRATVIAHLLERALETDGASGRRVRDYALGLRQAFGRESEPVALDLVVAGALTGLATGPFRLQRPRWARAVRRRLGLALRLARSPGEKTLRVGS